MTAMLERHSAQVLFFTMFNASQKGNVVRMEQFTYKYDVVAVTHFFRFYETSLSNLHFTVNCNKNLNTCGFMPIPTLCRPCNLTMHNYSHL